MLKDTACLEKFLKIGLSSLALSFMPFVNAAPPTYDFTWNGSVGSNYTNAQNWTPSGPPNSQSAAVNFPSEVSNVINFTGIAPSGSLYSFGSFDFNNQTYQFTLDGTTYPAILLGYGEGFVHTGSTILTTFHLNTATLGLDGGSAGSAAIILNSSTLGLYNQATLGNAQITNASGSVNSKIILLNSSLGNANIAFDSGATHTGITLDSTSTLDSAIITLDGATNFLQINSSNPNSTAQLTLSNGATLMLENGAINNAFSSITSTQNTPSSLILFDDNGAVPTASLNLAIGEGEIDALITDRDPNNPGGGILASGSLTIMGPGTVALSNPNNSLNEGITVEGGTLQIANSACVGGFNEPLTLSGGVLQFGGTGAFTLTSPTANGIVTTATSSPLDTNGNAVAINPSISGAGGIEKIGLGVLTLSGTNTYTGTTTVSAGTLMLGAVNAFPNQTDLTVNGGIFNLNDYPITVGHLNGDAGSINLGSATLTLNGDSSYGGTISGTGGISVETAGTTVLLSGSNNYTGLTTLEFGTTLQLSTLTSFPSENNLTNAGTFILNDFPITLGDLNGDGEVSLGMGTLTLAGQGDFSGNISGIGGVVVNTSGAMTLSGENNYLGSTVISQGALSLVGNGSIASSSSVSIEGTLQLDGVDSGEAILNNISGEGGSILLGSTILTVNQNATESFSGSLGGSGSFVKEGPAALTLSGANYHSGTTTVSAGSLIIDVGGSLTQTSEVNVASGASLIVNGSIGTSSSPTTLNVEPGAVIRGGSPDQATNQVVGTLNVFGEMAPGNSIGKFIVDGTYVQKPHSLFTYEFDASSADLLSVTQDIGIDSTATFHYVPSRDFYDSGTSYFYTVMETTQGEISGNFQNMTDDSAMVSAHLIKSLNNKELMLFISFTALKDIPLVGNPHRVAVALDTLHNKGNVDIDDLIFDFRMMSLNELSYSLNQLHPAQYKALAVVQQSNAVRVNQAVGNRMQGVLDQAHCVHNSFDSPKEARHVQFWTDLIGDWIHQDASYYASSQQVGYKNTTLGAVSGIDLNFAKYFYVGVMGAVTHANVSWDSGHGKGTVQSGYGGLYASALGKVFYANASVLGGWDSRDEHRAISFPGYNRTAYAKQHGRQLLSHLDMGANCALIGMAGWSLRPFDAVDYIVQTESGFTETGAGALNLKVKKSMERMLRNEAGLSLAKCFKLSTTRLMVDAKLSWVREMRLSGRDYVSQFINTGVDFTVVGNYLNRNLISPGLRVTSQMMEGDLDLTLYYDGAFTKGYQDQNLGLQCGIKF